MRLPKIKNYKLLVVFVLLIALIGTSIIVYRNTNATDSNTKTAKAKNLPSRTKSKEFDPNSLSPEAVPG